MGTGRGEIGRRGEDIACRYLIEKGHTILERNWRSGHLEVDIISLDREGLHFVEVKSRVAPFSAAPEESVGYVKQKRIAAAAERYIHSRKRKALVFELPDISFDVISIIFEGGSTGIEWFPGAYIPIHV
ncbi:MAG: YraN family protein [Bacteroidales bacterium]|nr:YraN family protein [Bacteroidales bacterium]